MHATGRTEFNSRHRHRPLSSPTFSLGIRDSLPWEVAEVNASTRRVKCKHRTQSGKGSVRMWSREEPNFGQHFPVGNAVK
jgi:hypothetical protein